MFLMLVGWDMVILVPAVVKESLRHVTLWKGSSFEVSNSAEDTPQEEERAMQCIGLCLLRHVAVATDHPTTRAVLGASSPIGDGDEHSDPKSPNVSEHSVSDHQSRIWQCWAAGCEQSALAAAFRGKVFGVRGASRISR